MIKKVILWILVISCMGLIFSFSAQKAEDSKKTSSGLITAVVKFFDFDNSLTEPQIQVICEDLTFIVRKAAHFSIYALLGILLCLLFGEYNITGRKGILLSVVIAMLYACSDELHQCFVDGRSGEIRDVLIDTAGAFVGCMVLWVFKRIVYKEEKR